MAIIYKAFNAYISDVFWPNLEKVGLLRLYLQHEKTISIFKIIKKDLPLPQTHMVRFKYYSQLFRVK